MDKLDQFYKKWNGKYPDYDGWYGSQCWDLAQYWSEMLGGPRFWGDADDIYDQPGSTFMQIANTADAVPQRGDLVIWDGKLNDGAGHVTIATGDGNTNRFKGFGVNWPTGSPAHVQEHNYDYVKGFLRPINGIGGSPQPQGDQPMTPEQHRYAYQVLLDRDEPDAAGGITGTQFISAIAPQVVAQRDRYKKEISDLQQRVIELEKAGGNVDQATKDQIAETNVIVKSLRDLWNKVFK